MSRYTYVGSMCFGSVFYFQEYLLQKVWRSGSVAKMKIDSFIRGVYF